MKPTPTQEQLDGLPKWARQHISDLEGQRDTAQRALKDFCDSGTPSPFYHEEHIHTDEGPKFVRRYVQANTITALWRGVELAVHAHDYGHNGKGIKLQWSSENKGNREIAMIPLSYQYARLVAKEDMD